MRLALIPPTPHIEMQADMDFILIQRTVERTYREHYQRSLNYKIMDNGVYENPQNIPENPRNIIRVAQELDVDEIILPDVIRSLRHTMIRIKEFFEQTTQGERNGFKLMAVPQGETPSEWTACYSNIIEEYPEIKVIGIPVWLEKVFRMRPIVVHYLLRKGYWSYSHEHHLLGLDYYGELWAYPPGIIRSVDTSLPFSRAIAEQNLFGNCAIAPPDDHKRITTMYTMNDRELANAQIEISILRNIARTVG